MPKREDEFWIAQKENFKYCYKHKRYYREEFGCQLCQIDKSSQAPKKEADKQKLLKCPKCKRISLWLNEAENLYECLNTRCRQTYIRKLFESEEVTKRKKKIKVIYPTPAEKSKGEGKMPKTVKTGQIQTEVTHTKKLCPHCGHDDFRVIENKMSWLTGEKFKCSKCGGTFKKANLVHVKGKSKEFDIRKTGYSQKPKKHGQSHKKH